MPTTKKYSLPRDFATKWVTALRSGEHKQGKHYLGNCEDGYCCLAVSALTVGAKDNMFQIGDLKATYLNNNIEYRQTCIVPEVYDKIPHILKSNKFDSLPDVLAKMNDSGNYTFPQIADWIEENVEFV